MEISVFRKEVIINLFLTVVLFSFFGCKDDDSKTCTTCNSSETISFELCREANGNASVNGEDTGTNYEVYLAGLQESNVTCGGG